MPSGSCVMTMDLEIWKILPWVANGRLEDEENARLAEELARHEQLRRSLDWEQALRDTIRTEAGEIAVPKHILPQVLARIAGESRARVNRPATGQSWLGKLFSGWQWTPQLALACGLVVLQFGVIGYLWPAQEEPDTYATVRNVAPPVEVPKTFLRIAFQDEVTERDMRDLLHAAGAEIVAGPGQIGDYYLYVAPEYIDRVAEAFMSDSRVAGLERVDALPSKH